MKYLIVLAATFAVQSTAFAVEIVFPSELANAEVCRLSGQFVLDCVDADGLEIIHGVSVKKISGFMDTEPKYNTQSTIALLRKQGMELRSATSGSFPASDLLFVRAR